MRAFDSFQGCHKFLIPPSHPVTTTNVNKMCNFYMFTFSSGLREPPVRRGRITPSYYPGWTPEEVKARLDHNSKMRNPKLNPSIQNQTKTVSFVSVAASKKPNNAPFTSQNQAQTIDWTSDNGCINSDYGTDEVYFEDLYGTINPNIATFTSNDPNMLARNQSVHQALKPIVPTNLRTKRPEF